MNCFGTSVCWWFSLPDWGSGDTFRFTVPVDRATAREQVLWFYNWERLPKGAQLETV